MRGVGLRRWLRSWNLILTEQFPALRFCAKASLSLGFRDVSDRFVKAPARSELLVLLRCMCIEMVVVDILYIRLISKKLTKSSTTGKTH